MPEKVRKSGQAPEKGPGKYRKRLDLGEYQKSRIMASVRKVEFGRVSKKGLGEYRKGGIWASIGNVGSGRVPEMWDPGEYQEGKI